MRTMNVVIELYKFNELSDKGKEIAQQNYINNMYSDWSHPLIQEFKDIGFVIGIEIQKILFNGFGFQGDGACFIGSFHHKKGGLKKLKKSCSDKEIISIATEIQDIQKRYNYKLCGIIVKMHSRYSHEKTVMVETYDKNDNQVEGEDWVLMENIFRNFMIIIYCKLEELYHQQTSYETINELEKEYLDSGELWD